MYREPYNKLANAKVQEDIEKLNENIEEERNKPDADMHKIMRMQEQKLIQGLSPQHTSAAFKKQLR